MGKGTSEIMNLVIQHEAYRELGEAPVPSEAESFWVGTWRRMLRIAGWRREKVFAWRLAD